MIRASGVADERGLLVAPGGLLVEKAPDGMLVHQLVEGHAQAGADRVVDLRDHILVPGMVNAHCHLDLTSVGPLARPQGEDFADWLQKVRANRPQDDGTIAASVRRGVELSLAGGVVAVGDIAGCVQSGPTLTPWRTLRQSPLEGISFVEFFAFGRSVEARLQLVERALQRAGEDRTMLGLQPHAPYSVNLPAYQRATELAERWNLPVCTHLAESVDERLFVADAAGPQRTLLESLGIWDEDELAHVGRGRHPVEHLEPVLSRRRWMLAHVNDCPDDAIQTLARTGASVVYCPRAHRYFGFGASIGPHRYRVMMERGVCVCLGTDSIINLPREADDPRRGRMSVLDEARVLYREDGVAGSTLLAMMTTNGARALGMDASRYRFESGRAVAGVVAVRSGHVDPLSELFGGGEAPVRVVV
ncbi:MAG: amidohydrolase family protein [Phycisphaerales bacterium]|nr:amidohydrolase family protein [Phycisphaerales bacterium]